MFKPEFYEKNFNNREEPKYKNESRFKFRIGMKLQ